MVPEGGSIVNAMKVAPAQQVMLKVRFLEVARSASREIGVNLVWGKQHDRPVPDLDYGWDHHHWQRLRQSRIPTQCRQGSAGILADRGSRLWTRRM
jgi:Flp pilus assembly secretin CpaC